MLAMANATGPLSWPGPRKELQRALAYARHDPQIVPITRHLRRDAPYPRVRSAWPADPTTCGSVRTVEELSAPLFVAAERPRKLAADRAPFGMHMGGKTKEQNVQAIRRYLRNASQPAVCRYRTCAVVGSSGSLRGAGFGAAIDSHDAVIRINAAPTFGHERAVGARTTWRVHNSEKPYMLAASDVPSLQLVICHMAWIGSCQHQAFSGAYTTTIAYVNPRFYGQLFTLLGAPRDKQSPSTGLLAIALALGACDAVSIYGFGSAGETRPPRTGPRHEERGSGGASGGASGGPCGGPCGGGPCGGPCGDPCGGSPCGGPCGGGPWR